MDSFFFTYVWRELGRRMRQATLTALGLAIGIGLVVTVTAASTGVDNALGAVLHSLYGIGTDVTVTKAAPPLRGRPTAGGFSPGQTPQREDLLGLAPGLGVLDASSVAAASHLHGVAAAAGGLTLTDTQLTVPSQSQLGPNGEPPASAFGTTFTVDGVDLAHLGLGPFASATLSSGRTLADSDAGSNVAVVDSNYATSKDLSVGSTMTIAGTDFKIIGIVRQPQGSGAADAYIPLDRAQALAQAPTQGLTDLKGKVSTIYVGAKSASDIPAVQAELSSLLPSATVTSSGNLAGAVSGSLANATSLAKDLGRWLAVAVLIAAFVVSSLLTMGAVTRRVREFGTLKALGWTSGRIVAQILGESLAIGVLGAAGGIALGFGGAALVTAVAPTLYATVAQNPGSAPAMNETLNGGGIHQSTAQGAVNTVAVHLTASVSLATIGLAVVIALAGALIAAALGGWVAARLRPSEALAQVE